jgi:PD-(D/E)XK nuclease superfamily
MALDGPLRLTNSEMTTWRRCRRKWYFSSYRRLRHRDEKPTGALSLGNLVHDALSVVYQVGGKSDPLARLDELTEAKVLEHPWHEDDIRKEGELAKIMVEGYVQWLEETGADQNIRVLAPESMVEVELAPGINLLSKLDARVERHTDPGRMALEFKTVQDFTRPLPTLQIDTQLLTEHLVEFLSLQERGETDPAHRARGVLYRMLRKVKRTAAAKPPFYAEEAVDHNVEELRNHWRHVMAIANDILDAHRRLDAGESHHTVAYPSPKQDCSWDCPFLAPCKLANSGDMEAYIAEKYEEADPLERYVGATSFE